MIRMLAEFRLDKWSSSILAPHRSVGPNRRGKFAIRLPSALTINSQSPKMNVSISAYVPDLFPRLREQ
jgi:hypothetical protein